MPALPRLHTRLFPWALLPLVAASGAPRGDDRPPPPTEAVAQVVAEVPAGPVPADEPLRIRFVEPP
ncbi:MAG: hypothetical protein AB1505_37205, partial [Candidatus Latescibacterota bacterium]